MRECSLAAQRGACCVHSCHQIRRCGGAGIAELSTTGPFAARTIRLLCRGLFSCVAMVHVRNSDARVQPCCSAGRVLRAQLPPDSQMWRRWHCRVKHNRALCCAHDPLALPRLIFVRCHGASARFRCVSAALLLSGARAACTAATGFADVAALAIAELSTTEAFAARTIRLLCRGLFSCVAMVHVCDSDAWVQLCCSAGRLLRAQLPPDSQMWRCRQLPS